VRASIAPLEDAVEVDAEDAFPIAALLTGRNNHSVKASTYLTDPE
jgi:hypothetical protein